MVNGNTFREMLKKAGSESYAIPAFNYSSIWDLLAIVETAQEENSPVMLASHTSVFDMMTPDVCAAVGRVMAEKSSIPIIYHLDHSSEIDKCKKAIDLNYPSVMIDASQETLNENIRRVTEVTDYAKAKGVSVEAEIGKIKGRGYEGGYGGNDFLASVSDAVNLVEATGIDTLAVGIGTAHGFYEGKPEIHFDRLAEIHDAIDIPLVLHGGSGIPEEDIQKAIKLGIRKINVGTIIHSTLMNSFRSGLIEKGENQFTLDIAGPAMLEVKEVVRGWIRTCMSNNKA